MINGEEDALKRANEFKELVQNLIKDIEHLYYIENKEPDEIANYLFHKIGQNVYSASEKQEVIDYIEMVIKSKRKD